jgi:hypothetical protein
MTIVKRVVHHYDKFGVQNEGPAMIQCAHTSGKTLQGGAMMSMNGLLFQLSALSVVAGELFNSLAQATKESVSRVNVRRFFLRFTYT